MVQVHWKHGQWSHHQREAEPVKEEQRPSAQEGPHSAPHTIHSNSLHWPCMLSVCVLGKKTCVFLPISRQVLPLGIFYIMDLPPSKWFGFQLSFLNRPHSPAGNMQLLLSRFIFCIVSSASSPLCIMHLCLLVCRALSILQTKG